ncbi:unnamed protein product [Closterium sp. Naga37s-1]|nr:unnamed protein product [Closterium sp. Naga37s-1]
MERMTDIDWPEDPQNDTSKEVSKMSDPSGSGSDPSASAALAKIQTPEPKSVRKDRRVSAAWNEAFFNKNADLDDDDGQLAPVLPPVDLSFLPMYAAAPSGDTAAKESANTPKDDQDAMCTSELAGAADHQRTTSEQQRMTSEQKVAAIVEKSSASDCSKHGGSTTSHAGTAERSKRAAAASGTSSHSRQAASSEFSSKGGAGVGSCGARVDLHSRFESSTDVEDSNDAGQSRLPEEKESLDEAQSHAISVSGEKESAITATEGQRDVQSTATAEVRFEEEDSVVLAASGAEKPAGNAHSHASESEIVAKSEDAPVGALRGMVGRGSKAMRACAPSPMKPAAAREPMPPQASAAAAHRGSSGSVSSVRSSNDSKQQQLREWQQQRQQAVAVKSRPSGSATAGGPPRPAVRAGASIGGKPGVGAGAVAARAGVPKSTSHCTSLVPASRSLVHGAASSGVGGSGLDVLRTSSTRSTGTSADAGKRMGFAGVGSHGGGHGPNRAAAAAGFAFSAAANSATAKVASAVARTVFSAKPRTLSKDVKAVSTEGSAGASQGSTSGAVGAPSAAGASSASGLFGLKFTAGKADDRAAVKKGAPAATSRRVSGVGARKARFGFGLGGKAAPTTKEKEEEAKEKAAFGGNQAAGQGGAKRVAADSKVASGKQIEVSKGGALAREKAPGASTSPLAAALKVAANHSKLLGLASRIPVPKATGRFGFGGSSSGAKAGAGKKSEKAGGRVVHGSGLGGKVEATHGRAGQQKTQQAHAGPSQTKVEAVTPRASRESNASHRSSSSQHSTTPHATNTPRASNTPHTGSTPRGGSSAQKKPTPRVEKKAGSGTHWVPGGVAQPSALAVADAAFSAMSTPRSSDAGQQLSRERAGEKRTGNDGQEEQQQQDEERRQAVHPGGVLTVAMEKLEEQGECTVEKDVGGDFGTVQGGGEGGEDAADEGLKTPGGKSGSESEKGRKGLSLKAIGAFVAGGSPWKKSARKVAAEREREESEEARNEKKEKGGSVVCTPQKSPGRAGKVETGESGASVETVEKEGERGAWASTEKVGEWVGEVLETAGTPDGCEQAERRRTPPKESELNAGTVAVPGEMFMVPVPVAAAVTGVATTAVTTPVAVATPVGVAASGGVSGSKGGGDSKQRRTSPLPRFLGSPIASLFKSPKRSNKKAQEVHVAASGTPATATIRQSSSAMAEQQQQQQQHEEEVEQQQQKQEESYHEAMPTPAAESPTLPRRSLFKAEQLKTDLFNSDLATKDLFKRAFPKPDFPQAPLSSTSEQPSEAPQNQKQAVTSTSLQSAASSSEAGMYTAPASPEAEEEGKEGQEGESRSILAQKGGSASRGRSLGASGRGMFTAPASPEADVEWGGEMGEKEEGEITPPGSAEKQGGGEMREKEEGEITPPGSAEKQGGGVERATAAVGAEGEDLDPFMRKVLEAEALGVVALEKKGGRVLNSPMMTKQPLPPRNPWSPVRKAEVGPYDCTKKSLAASLDSFSLPASSSGASNFSVTGRIGSGSGAAGFSGVGHAGMRMSYGH